MLAATLVACTSAPDVPPVGCTRPFVGDATQPIDLVPGAVSAGEFVELVEGSPLPLVTPPQGGHVSFVAVRAKNVDPCRVRITALLRGRESGYIIAEESRDISLTPLPTGWAEPNLADISSVANVPLCPDYQAEDIVDTDYTLEVRLTDRRGAAFEGRTIRPIVPRCTEPDPYLNALCHCECRANYELGKCADPLEAGRAP